jgi:two-component sensor histidine kinase
LAAFASDSENGPDSVLVVPRTKSLRSHLIIFGLLIVAPLLIVGIAIAWLYVTREQRELEQEAARFAREATQSVDRELKSYASALDVLSNSTNIGEENFQTLYNLALTVTKTIPNSAIAFRKVDGETIFSTLKPFGSEVPNPADQALIAADQAAIKSRNLVFSDVWTETLTTRPCVALVQPVISNGQVRYLLSLGIETKSVSEIINAQLKSKKWLIATVGNDKRIISRTWSPEQFVGQRATESFIQGAQGEAGTFYNTTLEKVQVFNSYVRSDLTGWIFVSALTANEFQAPIKESAAALFGLLAVGSALSVLFSYMYGKVLLKPARNLLELTAASVSENDARLSTGVKEFDFVAAKLRQSIAALSKRDNEKAVLIDELNHRGRNMLTAIQSIAYQSLRRAHGLQEFETSFNDRLNALAKSYHLLTKTEWQSVDLRSLVTECCKPFVDAERISVAGPAVPLHPNAVTDMAMVVHELATNASKHGSLRDPAGSISVLWKVEGSGADKKVKFEWKEKSIKFKWKEDDMPSSRDESGKSGFGSHLIAAICEGKFRSELLRRLGSDGFHFTVWIPSEFIRRTD